MMSIKNDVIEFIEKNKKKNIRINYYKLFI